MNEEMPTDVLEKLRAFLDKRGAKLLGCPYMTPGSQQPTGFSIPSGPYWRCRIVLPDGTPRRIYFNMSTWEEAQDKWLYADRPKKEES